MKCPSNNMDPEIYNVPAEDHWRDDNTCSYCGSMHPDLFIEKVRQGVAITPTDKNYKVYIDGMKKFYFEHLSEEQKNTFVQMLNDKQVKFEYPGHFYRLPFFITK